MLYKDSDIVVSVGKKLVDDFENTLDKNLRDSIFLDHIHGTNVDRLHCDDFHIDMQWLIISRGKNPSVGFNPCHHTEHEQLLISFLTNLGCFEFDGWWISRVAHFLERRVIYDTPDRLDPNYYDVVFSLPFLLKFEKITTAI